MRDELVSQALSDSVKNKVKDIEDLQEIWDILNTCFDQPEKYITKALDPINKFRK